MDPQGAISRQRRAVFERILSEGNPPPSLLSPPPRMLAQADERRNVVEWWLKKLEIQLSQRNIANLKNQLRSSSFRFLQQPSEWTHLETHVDPTTLSLDEDNPCNSLALTHEQWLEAEYLAGLSFLQEFVGDDAVVRRLSPVVERLAQDRDSLLEMKRTEWQRQRRVLVEANQVDPGRCNTLPLILFTHNQ